MIETTEGLAIHEDPEAVALAPPPNWFHCTNEIAEVEIRAVAEIVSSKVLFRYAGDPVNSSVSRFEARFGAMTEAKHVHRGDWVIQGLRRLRPLRRSCPIPVPESECLGR